MAVDGTYNIEIDTPMGKQESKLTLKSDGAKLSGTMESSFGKNDFTGTVKGDEVSWSMEINSPMGNMKLDYKGKVAGNDISGEVKAGDFGTSPFKGKKV
ncbi:MAG: hypothetical protein A2Y89_00600 [Chloroflexi bacterium RBG_13_51_18]|nr:MAG: hypothetical protein A2Y89_00600 [Chloroflexi bacterium RBG_13_51_18]